MTSAWLILNLKKQIRTACFDLLSVTSYEEPSAGDADDPAAEWRFDDGHGGLRSS